MCQHLWDLGTDEGKTSLAKVHFNGNLCTSLKCKILSCALENKLKTESCYIYIKQKIRTNRDIQSILLQRETPVFLRSEQPHTACICQLCRQNKSLRSHHKGQLQWEPHVSTTMLTNILFPFCITNYNHLKRRKKKSSNHRRIILIMITMGI